MQKLWQLRELIPAYFLALIVLASSWALFSPQFFRVHDYTHAGRLAEMARALADGHFPVRWTENFGYGYGMPLFEFYGPLPFYAGAALYWLGLSAVAAIQLLYVFTNIGTALGGYLLGKRFYGRAGGLITAAALTLAPYRALNLFVRGALNETWAIMFLPWILLGVIQIFHREKRGWLMLTVSLTGLFLSHNIMTLLFLPVLGLFVLGDFLQLLYRRTAEFFRKGRFRWRNFFRVSGQLVGSLLLAVGLASFYLFPAFLEKGLTQIERTILTSYFDYHLHFLYIRQFFQPGWGYGGSGWGVSDDISFFLGWGQWITAGLLTILFLKQLWLRLRKRQPKILSPRGWSLLGLSGALLAGTLFMSLLKSQWLWDQLSLLKFAQFPWRWLGISIVFLALVLGSVSWFLRRRLLRIFLSLVIVIGMAVGSAWYFRPQQYLENNEEFYYTDPQLIRRELSGVLPDYIAAGMTVPPTVIPEGLVVNAAAVPAEKYEILTDRTQEKLIRTDFESDTLMSLAVADYPGWRIEIDNQRWSREHGEDGNIAVMVPAGKHFVALRFLSTPTRLYADAVSLLALMILVWLLLPSIPLAAERKKAQR